MYIKVKQAFDISLRRPIVVQLYWTPENASVSYKYIHVKIAYNAVKKKWARSLEIFIPLIDFFKARNAIKVYNQGWMRRASFNSWYSAFAFSERKRRERRRGAGLALLPKCRTWKFHIAELTRFPKSSIDEFETSMLTFWILMYIVVFRYTSFYMKYQAVILSTATADYFCQ